MNSIRIVLRKIKALLLPIMFLMILLLNACSTSTLTTTPTNITTTASSSLTTTPISTLVTASSSLNTTSANETLTTSSTPSVRGTFENPIPRGESYYVPDDIEITVVNLIEGSKAWGIIDGVQRSNNPPPAGMKYVIVTVHLAYYSMEDPARWVKDDDFKLIGSSNQSINSCNKSIIMPGEGDLKELSIGLYKNEEETASLYFLVPEGETDLLLIWDTVLFCVK